MDKSEDEVWRFAVVDVETTGLEVATDQILQLAIVALDLKGPADPTLPIGPDAAQITDEWVTLVRTRRPWDSVGPRHIHGIRRRSLWGAPTLGRVLTEFGRRVDGRILTAHNAAFDAGFLATAAQREGMALPLSPRLCTLELSRRLDSDHQLRHRLADIAERLAIPHDNPHDALEDARTTAAVLPHLLAAHRIGDRTELAAHLWHDSTAQRAAGSS